MSKKRKNKLMSYWLFFWGYGPNGDRRNRPNEVVAEPTTLKEFREAGNEFRSFFAAVRIEARSARTGISI